MFNLTGSDVALIAIILLFIIWLAEKFIPRKIDIEYDRTVSDLRKEVHKYSIDARYFEGKYWEIKSLYDAKAKENK